MTERRCMIRYVESRDREAWFELDRGLPRDGFETKVRDGQGYVCEEGGKIVGILRYNLFWDSVPFCTLLFIRDGHRRRGYGRQLAERWERDMKDLGHGMVMTSTQSDEEAQHFWRKLGYRDSGEFSVDVPGYAQPPELIMIKQL